MQIKRLDLGHLYVVSKPWPVHGFVILHDTLGAVLVDTGCGAPDETLREYRVVNRTVADALATHGLSPVDITMVVNTHLHFDHCGQNAAFPHAPIIVQRAEHERVFRDRDEMAEWLEAAGARFELVDGDHALADDLQLVTTPGHTVGHQSVVATTHAGVDLFVGDAAYTRAIWERGPALTKLPPGQAADADSWRQSLAGLKARTPERVHFCHDDS
jgi:N-acyl homoserine lactone hydrolase